MATDRSISFNIFANDKASVNFKKVATAATGVGTAVAGANRTHLKDVAASAASAAGTVIKFGTDAVSSFKSAAGETLKLQKVFGGTAQDASRLRFAAKDTGVDVDLLAKGLAKASVVAAGNGKAYAALGIRTKDAAGHTRSMSQLLPELTNRFSKMQAGPAKTAAIMAIFGKSGLALTPILNKNASALTELGQKSDQYGQTLNGKALSAMKSSAQAQRDQKLAMDGVKVQLGASLMPIFAGFATLLSTKVIPVVTGIVSWMKQHKDIMLVVVGVIGTLIVATKAVSLATTAWSTITKVTSAATKIWTGVQKAFNLVMQMNPIMKVVIVVGLLVAAIVIAYRHSKTFRDIVEGAWKGIQSVVHAVWNGVLKPIFGFFVQAFKDVGRFATGLWNGIYAVFGGIGRIIGGVWNATIKPVFWVFKQEMGAVGWVAGVLWGGIKKGGDIVYAAFGVIKRAASSVKDFVVGAFNAIGGSIKWVINGIIGGIDMFIRAIDSIHFSLHLPKWLGGAGFTFSGFGIPQIPYLAAGGIVKASPGGTLALLGEGGRDEAVIPLGRGGGGNRGGNITIIINGPGSPAETARMVRTELLHLKRSGGISTLGLA